jgi:superfamily I DNA/RNA helicase
MGEPGGSVAEIITEALRNDKVPDQVARLVISAMRRRMMNPILKRDAVRVGTMHGMKGPEFQAVAVLGVAEGSVPAPGAVTPATDDPVTHAQDLQRERRLLFVACTRARDHLYLSCTGTPSPFLARK